jgi:iron complex transport system permease protein
MNKRIILLWTLLGLVGVAVLAWSLQSGSMDLSATDWWHWLNGSLSQADFRTPIMELRMYRLVTVFFSGAVLSLCGLYMQALVRNPLADPYLLGASSGAGFGVSLITAQIITWVSSIWFLPIVAFLGSLGSLVLVLVIGRWQREHQTYRILMAGVAVSSLFTALTGFMMYVFTGPEALRSILFWTLGSFNQSGRESAWVSAFALIPVMAFGWIRARRLDVLILGEQHARALGLNLQSFRLELIFVCALSAGLIAAFCGPIGFVGLMMPHFSRAWLGAAHRRNVQFLPLIGGIYLLFCDTLGREIIPPAGIPIGIITALFGIPFFLFLLGKKIE